MVSRTASARDGSSRQRRPGGSAGRDDESWFVWHRELGALGQPGHRVEIAFRVSAAADGSPRLVGIEDSPLVVFFPTQKETFLGFLIQGPYRTTPARDNVPEHDAWNQDLARETAALLAAVLRELRDEGLLTAEVLAAMPVDAARFPPGSMLRPVYESARDALGRDELIPAAGGGYGTARDLKLARGGGLRELLAPDQLGELYGDGGPAGFADESITENRTAGLWRYLREDVGVEEVTPEAVVARLTAEFLAAQPDEWIAGSTRSCTATMRCGVSQGMRTSPQARQGRSQLSGSRTAVRLHRSVKMDARPPTSRARPRISPARAAPGLNCPRSGAPSRKSPTPGSSSKPWGSPSRTWCPRCWTSCCPGTTAWTSRSWTRRSTTPTSSGSRAALARRLPPSASGSWASCGRRRS